MDKKNIKVRKQSIRKELNNIQKKIIFDIKEITRQFNNNNNIHS